MNKRGFEWGILGKALLFLFILTVAFIIISGLAGGSSGKLGSLSNLIPGIPEKAPVLEVGQKLENAPCRFSYECSTGFMCWKGDAGGEGLGACIKEIEAPQLLVISGKHVTNGGNCYGDAPGYVKDWLKAGKLPRTSSIILKRGIYQLEAGNDKIYVDSAKKKPAIEPALFAFSPDVAIQSYIKPLPGAIWDVNFALTAVLNTQNTYVLYLQYDATIYGGFHDSNCDDNSGFNTVRVDKVAGDPIKLYSVK